MLLVYFRVFFLVGMDSKNFSENQPQNDFNKPSLIQLLNQGNIEEVKKQVMDGADVNELIAEWSFSFFHFSPPSFVVTNSLLRSLIINRKNFDEQCVLELISLLIKKGVDLNFSIDKTHATVLHEIAFSGIISLAGVILSGKPNLNVRNACECTPLHLAVIESESDHNSVALKIMNAGADVNARNQYGETPLHLAAQFNNKQSIESLLKYNANIQIKDNYGKRACDYAKDSVIKALLS